MNVLLVSSSAGSKNGTELYLSHLAHGLQRQGHEIGLLVSDDDHMDGLVQRMPRQTIIIRQPLAGPEDRRFGAFSARRDRAGITALETAFREIDPDIIHVNRCSADDGLDRLIAAERAGIPCLSTVHSPLSPTQLKARFGWLRRLSASRAEARSRHPIITVSNDAAERLAAWLPRSVDDRLETVYNGVPEPRATQGARVRTRERFGIGPRVHVIGVVGRLVEDKGALFLLEVMKLMDERRCCPVLFWIGDGPAKDDFLARATEYGLGERVVVTGWVQRSADYLATLDCFCLPSTFEGMPLALIEAMRMQHCCVANDVGGIGEALQTDLSGILMPVGDVTGWANTLETVLADKEFRAELGEGAQKAARARFSLNRMATDTLAIYESMLLEDALETTP